MLTSKSLWIVITVALGSLAAFAADETDHAGLASHRHHRGPGQFLLGLCVGQTLAEQGVALPVPQAGQPPAFDAATQAAFRSAIESCRSGGAAPSPTSTPEPSPTSTPTSAPTSEPSTS